ncbi:MAG: YHS domain-containing protein [Syntrophobacteraceae bacterium]
MKRFKIIAVSGVFFGLLCFGLSMPAMVYAAPQTNCPVLSKDPINKKIFVDYKGKRIYFCCRSCIAQFKKNPEKYMKQMEAQGVTPEKIPSLK